MLKDSKFLNFLIEKLGIFGYPLAAIFVVFAFFGMMQLVRAMYELMAKDAKKYFEYHENETLFRVYVYLSAIGAISFTGILL